MVDYDGKTLYKNETTGEEQFEVPGLKSPRLRLVYVQKRVCENKIYFLRGQLYPSCIADMVSSLYSDPQESVLVTGVKLTKKFHVVPNTWRKAFEKFRVPKKMKALTRQGHNLLQNSTLLTFLDIKFSSFPRRTRWAMNPGDPEHL